MSSRGGRPRGGGMIRPNNRGDDAKDGKNQYIPQFISNAPWYHTGDINPEQFQPDDGLGDCDGKDDKKDYLAHQRLNPQDKSKNFSVAQRGQGVVDSYQEIIDEKALGLGRSRDRNKRPFKALGGEVRGGAFETRKKSKLLMFKNNKIRCSNCGSVNHKRIECLEKPKKVAVQHRDDVDGETIRKDQQQYDRIRVRDEKTISNYDAKRDNYYGYDDKEWEQNLNKMRDLRRAKQKKAVREQAEREAKEKQAKGDEGEEDEEAAMLEELGLVGDSKALQSLKQDSVKAPGEKTIRLLEDRASYLESITAQETPENEDDDEFVKKLTYNPKTRSILDPKMGEYNEKNLFVRHFDGEAAEFEQMKQFAWNEQRKVKEEATMAPARNGGGGSEISSDQELAKAMEAHPEATPTALALQIKKKKEETKRKMAEKKKILEEKYGLL